MMCFVPATQRTSLINISVLGTEVAPARSLSRPLTRTWPAHSISFQSPGLHSRWPGQLANKHSVGPLLRSVMQWAAPFSAQTCLAPFPWLSPRHGDGNLLKNMFCGKGRLGKNTSQTCTGLSDRPPGSHSPHLLLPAPAKHTSSCSGWKGCKARNLSS